MSPRFRFRLERLLAKKPPLEPRSRRISSRSSQRILVGVVTWIGVERLQAPLRHLLASEQGTQGSQRVFTGAAVERMGTSGAAQVHEHDLAGAPDLLEITGRDRGVRAGALARSAGEDEERVGLGRAAERLQNRELDVQTPARVRSAILEDLVHTALNLLGQALEVAGNQLQARGVRGSGTWS